MDGWRREANHSLVSDYYLFGLLCCFEGLVFAR